MLSNFFVKYPYILDIQTPSYEKVDSIENPRVLLRPNKEVGQEPLLILNHKIGKNSKVTAYFPHRKTTALLYFQMEEGEDMGTMQKNWAPFNHQNEYTTLSKFSDGYVHFVQTFSPIQILNCSLDDGLCKKTFNGDTMELSEGTQNDNMIGGTQFVSLPDVLPAVKDKNIWVSFAKTHLDKCGCGNKFRRPALTVMIHNNGTYHLELIAPGMDFTIAPLNSKLKTTDCEGDNVITVGSIISWTIASQDKLRHSFEDYMRIDITQPGNVTKRVIIRGLLDYILGIYKAKDIKDTFEIDNEAHTILGKTTMCASDHSFEVCRRYGLVKNQKGTESLKIDH